MRFSKLLTLYFFFSFLCLHLIILPMPGRYRMRAKLAKWRSNRVSVKTLLTRFFGFSRSNTARRAMASWELNGDGVKMAWLTMTIAVVQFQWLRTTSNLQNQVLMIKNFFIVTDGGVKWASCYWQIFCGMVLDRLTLDHLKYNRLPSWPLHLK